LKFRSTIVGGGGTVGKGIDVPELKLRGAEGSRVPDTVVPNRLESVDEVVGREVGKIVELLAEELVLKLFARRLVGRADELAVKLVVGRLVGRVVELFPRELVLKLVVGRLIGRAEELAVKLFVGRLIGRLEELAVKLVVGRLVGKVVELFAGELAVRISVGRAEELAVKLVVGRLVGRPVGRFVKLDIPFYKRCLLFSVPASLL
jgi:hypothetical protein